MNPEFNAYYDDEDGWEDVSDLQQRMNEAFYNTEFKPPVKKDEPMKHKDDFPNPHLTDEEFRISRLIDMHMFQGKYKCTGVIVRDVQGHWLPSGGPAHYRDGFFRYVCKACGTTMSIK